MKQKIKDKIKNKILENFNLTEDQKALVEEIICDDMNLLRCDDIIDSIISLRLDEDSLVGFLGYQLFKVLPEKADKISNKFSEDELKIYNSFKVIKDINNLSRSEEAEDIRKMFLALSKDLRVVIIKLAGILYDLKTLKTPLNEEKRFFVSNVRTIFAPLAERLGLGNMKSTMEDYCFKFENPKMYHELENNILLKKDENDKQIEITKEKLENILKELNIDGEITFRQKHISSIFKKLQFKGVTLAQIYDLIAMRVLVNTVEECYAVFGKIHSIYRPMQGRVKDYIANPKPNGYQSLHTTVITENQRPMEIQIRTYEMHRNSEFGIAAHWIYKEKRAKTTALDKKLFWFREIMENAKSMPLEEFVETLKTDLYDGEIFVQTPKGKVLQFPDGATIIDFAYAIHSDVGNTCVGGKINNKMRPLTTKLKSGDIVEIITNPNSKGPSRDWLNIVRTSSARGKIKQFFKSELKEENIKNGKTMLEQSIQERGFTSNQLLTHENITEVLTKYNMTEIDELYAEIGSESLSVGQVVGRFINLYSKSQIKQKTGNVHDFKEKNKSQDIIVDGSDDMLIKYASCCNPIVGDDIVGYISHGQGITIHRTTCKTLQHLEKERLLPATWSDKSGRQFIAVVKVVAEKNPTNIARITTQLAESKIGIRSFESNETKNEFNCSIAVYVSNKEDIDKVITAIENLKGIQKVYRAD